MPGLTADRSEARQENAQAAKNLAARRNPEIEEVKNREVCLPYLTLPTLRHCCVNDRALFGSDASSSALILGRHHHSVIALLMHILLPSFLTRCRPRKQAIASRPSPPRPLSTSHAPSPSETAQRLLHEQYLAKLEVPTSETIATIASVQEERERQIDEKYHGGQQGNAEEERNAKEEAAGVIQRTYRSHHDQARGDELSLDPSTRWTEAVKEARYRTLISPHAPRSPEKEKVSPSADATARTSSEARRNWHRINQITLHARGDSSSTECSDTSSISSGSSNSLTHASRHHLFHRHPKAPKPWKGKMMDLGYFLELVDLKHRYGANLKVYHTEWKKSPTPENFFYWLDYGEGKEVDLPGLTRATLEKEKVRYLSREERVHYMVDVDNTGKLVWARNREHVDTSEQWKDSVLGIVPKDEEVPDVENLKFHDDDLISKTEEEAQRKEEDEAERRYPDPPDLKDAKGPRKLFHITPATIMNHLMRSSIKKNTWIFVFSTAHQLYVSLKAPGTFQHSSFLHGSRILAAGLLTVSDGQLRSLSPLSGHYRPTSTAFRHFINWLKDQGVDMSKVHLSKSYAVLIGLETFVGAKAAFHNGMEKVFKPQEAHLKQNEKQRDLNWDLEKEAQKNRGDGMGMEELGKIATELKKAASLGNEQGSDNLEEGDTKPFRDQKILQKDGENLMTPANFGTASTGLPHTDPEAQKVLSDDQHLEDLPINLSRNDTSQPGLAKPRVGGDDRDPQHPAG
ncbi:hypothetical protein MMC11_005840 [Xylographa trunciseda]|nr:hypothetical protein [Xylographa trunciseda]